MLDRLFGKNTLPKGYEIRSSLSDSGITNYVLFFGRIMIAHEFTYVTSHKTCLRRLRKAAREHEKNGVVPR